MTAYSGKIHGLQFACASIGVLLVVLATSYGAIVRQLNDWKLLPEPQHLTELYFTKPNNLPTTYTVNSPQVVSFTVHNLEYKTTDYHYKIVEYSNDGSESKELENGSFVLRQNATTQPNVSVLPANFGTRVEITVELANVNESVDYWVNAT